MNTMLKSILSRFTHCRWQIRVYLAVVASCTVHHLQIGGLHNQQLNQRLLNLIQEAKLLLGEPTVLHHSRLSSN